MISGAYAGATLNFLDGQSFGWANSPGTTTSNSYTLTTANTL